MSMTVHWWQDRDRDYIRYVDTVKEVSTFLHLS
jgi:hypothetical protein